MDRVPFSLISACPLSRRWKYPLALVLALTLAASRTAVAAVAVVSNRTENEVTFTLLTPDAQGQHLKASDYKLPPGDLTVLNLRRGETSRLSFSGVTYPVQADAAYYFGASSASKPELVQIGLAGMPEPTKEPQPIGVPTAQRNNADDDAARTIPVKLFVDEEENSKPAVWQRRLKDRVAAVSAVLEHNCGMRLKVVGYGTWQSDNQIHDFEEAVTEFVRKVDPGEARLAIGFTSQYQITKGRTHLGGTRGPLAHHILLREWSQFVERAGAAGIAGARSRALLGGGAQSGIRQRDARDFGRQTSPGAKISNSLRSAEHAGHEPGGGRMAATSAARVSPNFRPPHETACVAFTRRSTRRCRKTPRRSSTCTSSTTRNAAMTVGSQ